MVATSLSPLKDCHTLLHQPSELLQANSNGAGAFNINHSQPDPQDWHILSLWWPFDACDTRECVKKDKAYKLDIVPGEQSINFFQNCPRCSPSSLAITNNTNGKTIVQSTVRRQRTTHFRTRFSFFQTTNTHTLVASNRPSTQAI